MAEPKFDREDVVTIEGIEYRVGFRGSPPIDFGPLPPHRGDWYVFIGGEWIHLPFAPEHQESGGMPLSRLLEPHIRQALRGRRAQGQ